MEDDPFISRFLAKCVIIVAYFVPPQWNTPRRSEKREEFCLFDD
jgi:hypothetical protein